MPFEDRTLDPAEVRLGASPETQALKMTLRSPNESLCFQALGYIGACFKMVELGHIACHARKVHTR